MFHPCLNNSKAQSALVLGDASYLHVYNNYKPSQSPVPSIPGHVCQHICLANVHGGKHWAKVFFPAQRSPTSLARLAACHALKGVSPVSGFSSWAQLHLQPLPFATPGSCLGCLKESDPHQDSDLLCFSPDLESCLTRGWLPLRLWVYPFLLELPIKSNNHDDASALKLRQPSLSVIRCKKQT